MSDSEGEGKPPPAMDFESLTSTDVSGINGDGNIMDSQTQKSSGSTSSIFDISQSQGMLNNYHNKVENNRILYTEKDTGPFIVVIEASDKLNINIGKISQLKIAKELLDQNVKDIIKLKVKGKRRIAIEFLNYMAANKFSMNKGLVNKGYNIYIPYNMVTCKGIIRHVDIDYDTEVLKTSIVSDQKIINIRRLNRKKISEGNVDYLPTGTVLLTFAGTILPRSVEIWKLPFAVVPYVPPVTQCHACHRYGHTKTQCKSRLKCHKCAGDPHPDDIECNKKCFHCGSEHHTSFYSQCPEHQRQTSIRHLMAFNNLTFFDAAQLCPVSYKSSQPQINQSHPLDFPPLSKNLPSQSNEITVSQRRVITAEDQRIRSKRTYSQIVSNKNNSKRRYTTDGFDKDAHNDCLDTPNGRDYNNSTPTISRPTNLGEKVFSLPTSATPNFHSTLDFKQFYTQFLLLPLKTKNDIRDSINKYFKLEQESSSNEQ